MSYEIDEPMPIIGKLIKNAPHLFNRTEIIGVFRGEDICSSFLNHGDNLERQDWYENYHCFKDLPPAVQIVKRNELGALYKNMMESCPNLTIHIVDGAEFEGHADFTFIDVHNQPFDVFCAANAEKFTNWYATCGYGGSIEHTASIINMFTNKTAFPVMKCRDNIFMTNTAEQQKTYFDLIIDTLPVTDYSVQYYNSSNYINIQGRSGYETDMARQANDQ
jgi:hypothetical protein